MRPSIHIAVFFCVEINICWIGTPRLTHMNVTNLGIRLPTTPAAHGPANAQSSFCFELKLGIMLLIQCVPLQDCISKQNFLLKELSECNVADLKSIGDVIDGLPELRPIRSLSWRSCLTSAGGLKSATSSRSSSDILEIWNWIKHSGVCTTRWWLMYL